MKKLILLMLLVASIASNSYADELPNIQFSMLRNASEASTVVEVLGSGKGSGVLVSLEGRPVIVTNSHNLQGKLSALVSLPKRQVEYYLYKPVFERKSEILGFKGIAKVLYDFPLSDVTILAMPEDMNAETTYLIHAMALQNGVLSAKKGWAPSYNSPEWGDMVSAILNNKPTTLKAIEGFRGGTTPDIYISGDESPIWAIPVFSKPGVSGGAFYRNGILMGLVTKISLAGEPITLATPFTKIAKLIYSPDKSEQKVSWSNGLMVYETQDKTVSANPLASGWIGNGGELTEVDESLSGDTNPNYWRLQIAGYGEKRIITTWDPFVYRPGQFKIGQQNVGFVKVTSKSFFKKVERYHTPTLASFVANERKGDQQTMLSNTPQNLQMLKDARLKRETNINFGRLYNRTDKYFAVFNLRYSNVNGAQPLKPVSDKKWAKTPFYNPLMGPPPVIIMDGDVSVDEDGYFSNIPFSTKISKDTIFDLKINGHFFGTQGIYFLKGAANLSQVSFTSQDGQETILKPTEANSPNSLVFQSEDNTYRAIYLYSNDDLTNLARIYIESENSLIELWAN